MNEKRVSISVVSTGARRLTDALRSCLAGDGSFVLRGRMPEEALEEPPADVTLVDVDSLNGHQLRCLEPLVSDNPSVALVSSAISDDARRLVACCGESLYWPGQRHDLACLLSRLADDMLSPPSLEQVLALRLNLVGQSAPFQEVLHDIRRYSCCDAPVLILGETGTGKEKVARCIHYSGNEGGAFIAVNCGALPDTLIENELFGHKRGAYTDAREARKGLVEQAEGGSLFLDEIEALSRKGQVALLRFLQDYEYRPLGAERTRKAHLRLITATNEPLEELVGQGRFRRDLFYRINILSLKIPPLRERGEDVLLLADYFLERYRLRYGQADRHLSEETRAWMVRADWPGNVRELENLLLRAFLLAEGTEIRIEPPVELRHERRHGLFDRRMQHLFDTSFQEAKGRVIDAFERSYLEQKLRETRGNVSRAARLAGKERRSFVRLLQKHGLDRQHYSHDRQGVEKGQPGSF